MPRVTMTPMHCSQISKAPLSPQVLSKRDGSASGETVCSRHLHN